MSLVLSIPRISMNMQEATVTEWFKQPGDTFAKGDPLYAIETEKVVNEIEATENGKLLEILIVAGDECVVGDAVARVEYG